MKKTLLGVAMVVGFCITWWLVAGDAWQAIKPAEQAIKPAEQARLQAAQGRRQAALASEQARQASTAAGAHFRTQATWGVGAGLLVNVLLLVGALAWSKITDKA